MTKKKEIMQKEKVDNIIVRWFRLCQPHKFYWAMQILFYTLYTSILAIMTIFAARTINCLYAHDWKGAYFYLILELANIIFRNVFMHIQYYFYNKQASHIYTNVCEKTCKKVFSVDPKCFNSISREKYINIALNNMSNLVEFPDVVASFIGYSVLVCIALVSVFSASWIAGLVVMAIGVINCLAYLKFNKKLGRLNNSRCESKDILFTNLAKFMSGAEVINEHHGQASYQKKYLSSVKNYTVERTKYYRAHSAKSNLYYATWNIFIYAITAFLIFQVSKNSIDMATYLIIVPYLTSCTEKLNTLFDKTKDLELMRVDVDRINLLLSLNDKQTLQYGKINTMVKGYNLGLIDVSYKSPDRAQASIKNADVSFKINALNVIKGEHGCGKRHIFDMLRRRIKPDKGIVLLDNLNLYYYNEKTFKNHIDYCSAHPQFINGSIRENLLIANKDFKKAETLFEQLQIKKELLKLPQGYDTNISEINNKNLLFLLGLTRAMLSDCKILMIYELPEDNKNVLRKKINHMLANYQDNKTLILFTHTDIYDVNAALCYEVKNGKIKLAVKNPNKEN